jgi:hypothetical protein
VFLDNFNAKELSSDILASAPTENPAMVRVMGKTKNVSLNARTFIGITGNGVEIAEDMARRIIKAAWMRKWKARKSGNSSWDFWTISLWPAPSCSRPR